MLTGDSDFDLLISRSMQSQLGIDRSIQHVRKLHWLVTALANQLKHRRIGKRTNLMKNLRASRSKELLDLTQLLSRDRFKNSETESLRDRRSGAVKHRMSAG